MGRDEMQRDLDEARQQAEMAREQSDLWKQNAAAADAVIRYLETKLAALPPTPEPDQE